MTTGQAFLKLTSLRDSRLRSVVVHITSFVGNRPPSAADQPVFLKARGVTLKCSLRPRVIITPVSTGVVH